MVYEEAHVNQYLGFNYLYRGDINKPSLLVSLHCHAMPCHAHLPPTGAPRLI